MANRSNENCGEHDLMELAIGAGFSVLEKQLLGWNTTILSLVRLPIPPLSHIYPAKPGVPRFAGDRVQTAVAHG